MMKIPDMLFARRNGELLDLPGIEMTGKAGNRFVKPSGKDLIPLPEGATLTALPYRIPIGLDNRSGKFSLIRWNPYSRKKEEVWAVGALLPQGFTRTLVPGFSGGGGLKPLPLLGYSAVGLDQGKFVVAANKTDEDYLWNPVHYNTEDLVELVEQKKKDFPQNRLIQQLGICVLEYGCFTAQNIFYQRWEGGIPVSPKCNARCVACISSQPSECCPAPQRRLDFIPTMKEIEELAVCHLSSGKDAIISFGQGCEGEPSLQAGLIAQSIAGVRKMESRGTINMNTNAGDTPKIKEIIDAGLNSIRVSMISPTPEIYHAYHRPHGYHFGNVLESLKYASASGVYTSLNLLVFPGITDDESELDVLFKLVRKGGINKIQLRNLNIDPDMMMKVLPKRMNNPLGIPRMIELLKKEAPGLEIGSYSRAVEK
jgi:pyruvate-formate lyase-activating enzyme